MHGSGAFTVQLCTTIVCLRGAAVDPHTAGLQAYCLLLTVS
jgi:hypothetical protein